MAEPSSRTSLGEGAAQEAPTAPHATPRRDSGPRTGPERFWARWPVRLALAGSLVVSGLAHCAVVPFDLPHGFEVNDVEGEAAIPIDVLEPESPPPPPEPVAAPAPEETAESAQTKPPGPGPRDAGAEHDAALDGSADASRDAAADASRDGASDALEAGLLAAADAGMDGAVALGDASAPGTASGPRSPEDIVGAAGAIQADTVLVMMVVNAEAIRHNVAGARMGYLLRGIPQWDEFMSGTDIDPVRDTDWVMVFGPSLVNTARDVVLVHYAASDAVVDHAVDVVSRKYDRGGPIDAGVPGVKASLAHADRAERVLLRPRAHLLAVVPPDVATKVARQLAAKSPAFNRPKDEAVYLRLVNPHHPFPEIPEAITEMRMRVVGRSDSGADVFIDGDVKEGASASDAADGLRRVVRRHNDTFTSMLTHGLLDGVTVTAEGNQAKLHVTVTLDQIETLATLVGSFLGIQPPPAPGAVAPTAPPRPPPQH